MVIQPSEVERNPGAGIVRAEGLNVSFQDYKENEVGWLPGKVVGVIIILSVLFILVITLLIFQGYG